MNPRSILTGLLLIVFSGSIISCGSSTKVTNTKETSVGQQLSDLDDAHQKGIVTDGEFKRLKKAIIKAND
jgi:hypothetical protein